MTSGQRRHPWMCAAAIYLVAFASSGLLDALAFRTGFYEKYVDPESTTGTLEAVLHDELNRRPRGRDDILVIGDSRIAEGFSVSVANRRCGNRNWYFANASFPAATLRCWYYELRELDPAQNRYKAIVLPVDSYDDIDLAENLANRTLDLHYLAARLRYGDIFEFAFSFDGWRERWEAIRGGILKGFIYQQDLLDLMEHRARRLRKVELWRLHGWEWRRDYGGNAHDLKGLEVDWPTRTMRLPPQVPPEKAAELRGILFDPIPHTGTMAAYRKRWLGKILEAYNGSRTKIVFLALPRGPAPRPDVPARQSHSVLEFGRRPGVILLPERAFESLEYPEFYFDGLHLNSRGRERFSALLADLVLKTLAIPAQY